MSEETSPGSGFFEPAAGSPDGIETSELVSHGGGGSGPTGGGGAALDGHLSVIGYTFDAQPGIDTTYPFADLNTSPGSDGQDHRRDQTLLRRHQHGFMDRQHRR